MKLQKRHSKYDWDDWLGRDYFELVAGEHYHVSQSAMVQQIRNMASRYGFKVSIVDNGTSLTVQVRER